MDDFTGNFDPDSGPDLSRDILGLKRPKILIRAARIGAEDYRRERDLKRLTKCRRLLSPKRAMASLMGREQQLEHIRRLGDAAYSIAHHVEVLAALMAEMRLTPRCRTAR